MIMFQRVNVFIRCLVSIFVWLVVDSSANFQSAFFNLSIEVLIDRSLLSLLLQDQKTFHIEEPRRTQQLYLLSMLL